MSKTERIARRYVIRGRVQGVGYRYFARDRAMELSVTGWVRNRDDGTVEALACGTAAQLDAFSGYLHQGPRFGDVRGVEQQEAALLQSDGFSIR